MLKKVGPEAGVIPAIDPAPVLSVSQSMGGVESSDRTVSAGVNKRSRRLIVSIWVRLANTVSSLLKGSRRKSTA